MILTMEVKSCKECPCRKENRNDLLIKVDSCTHPQASNLLENSISSMRIQPPSWCPIKQIVKIEFDFSNVKRTGSVEIPEELSGKPFKVTFEEVR